MTSHNEEAVRRSLNRGQGQQAGLVATPESTGSTAKWEGNEAAKAALINKVVMQGDLKALTTTEKMNYYRLVCETLGVNPFTRPFDFLRDKRSGKISLYPRKELAEQLAGMHRVSIDTGDPEVREGLVIVKAKASREGQFATCRGAVALGGLTSEEKANAFLKAETKASRRAVLRLLGLSLPSVVAEELTEDSEVLDVDQETGEVKESPVAELSQSLADEARGLFFGQARDLKLVNDKGDPDRQRVHRTLGLGCPGATGECLNREDCHALTDTIKRLTEGGLTEAEAWAQMSDRLVEMAIEDRSRRPDPLA